MSKISTRFLKRLQQTIRSKADRVAGMADQALFSIATLVQTYVYAKVLPAESFAIFGLVQGSCLMAQGVQRSTTILPMIMTSHGAAGDGRWMQFDVLLRVATPLVLVCMAMFLALFNGSTSLGAAFFLAAPCVIFTLSYEFERRILFLRQDAQSVVIAAAIYCAMASSAVVIVGFFLPQVEIAVAGLAVAAGLAALFARSRRPAMTAPTIHIREHANIIGWNLLSFLPYSIYNNATVLIVGVFYDARSVALFVASRLFTAPIQTLIQAIDSVDKPRARRQYASGGVKGLRDSLNQTRWTMLLLGTPYLLAVFIFSDFFTSIFFGQHFDFMSDAIRVWVIVAFMMLVGQPLETGLLTLRRSDLLFWTRGVAAVTMVTVLMLAEYWEPLAPIIALAAGWTAGAALALLMLVRNMRAARQQDDLQAAGELRP